MEQTYWQANPFRAVAEPGIQLKVLAGLVPFWSLCLHTLYSSAFTPKAFIALQHCPTTLKIVITPHLLTPAWPPPAPTTTAIGLNPPTGPQILYPEGREDASLLQC